MHSPGNNRLRGPRLTVTATCVAACLLVGSGSTAPGANASPDAVQPILVTLRGEAQALGDFVESAVGRAYVQAVGRLPAAPVRVVYRDPVDRRRHYPPAHVAALPEDRRAALERVELAAESFYTTRYGSPLAYARALDLVGRRGLDDLTGKRVADFGYGSIGQLRLLALCGAEAVGIDIDSFLAALYCAPEDQGPVDGAGRVRLVHGHWPGDEAVRAEVGQGYDLFLSKNTLKRGYVHPERAADARVLIDLGASDERYLAQVFALLSPGGWMVAYNLSPAQTPPEDRYRPWADGRFPFSRAHVEACGFEVVLFDEDDTTAARDMARRLGWHEQGMDVDTDLFAHVTILRKPQ